MKSRVVSLLLISMLVLSLFCGCSSKNDTGTLITGNSVDVLLRDDGSVAARVRQTDTYNEITGGLEFNKWYDVTGLGGVVENAVVGTIGTESKDGVVFFIDNHTFEYLDIKSMVTAGLTRSAGVIEGSQDAVSVKFPSSDNGFVCLMTPAKGEDIDITELLLAAA